MHHLRPGKCLFHALRKAAHVREILSLRKYRCEQERKVLFAPFSRPTVCGKADILGFCEDPGIPGIPGRQEDYRTATLNSSG